MTSNETERDMYQPGTGRNGAISAAASAAHAAVRSGFSALTAKKTTKTV